MQFQEKGQTQEATEVVEEAVVIAEEDEDEIIEMVEVVEEAVEIVVEAETDEAEIERATFNLDKIA
jgi:hypothetical protein